MTKIADLIRDRIEASGASYVANANIAQFIQPGELAEIEAGVAAAFAGVLDALVIDTKRDHNTRETAKRVAKMYVREVFAGRYCDAPAATDFPNVTKVDQVDVIGPIKIRSACSHHFVPIMGEAWVGVIPGKRVIGLSKFSRLAEWVMTRPQIQEEAVEMLADQLEAIIQPHALGIIVRAKHFCCGWRGVRDEGQHMTTSIMRGAFLDDASARAEFMQIVRGHGF